MKLSLLRSRYLVATLGLSTFVAVGCSKRVVEGPGVGGDGDGNPNATGSMPGVGDGDGDMTPGSGGGSGAGPGGGGETPPQSDVLYGLAFGARQCASSRGTRRQPS